VQADTLTHFKQGGQCTFKCNTGTRSRNRSCRGKAVSVNYSECVFVALGIQHA